MINTTSKQIKINLTIPIIVLFVAFFLLELNNYIDWSWLWLISPLWIPFALALIFLMVIITLKMFSRISPSKSHKEIFSSLGILDRYDIVYDWTNKDPLHTEAIGLVKKGEEQYPPEVIFFKRDGKFMYSFCAVVLDSLGSGYKYLDSEVGFDSLEECVNECYMKILRPLDIKYN